MLWSIFVYGCYYIMFSDVRIFDIIMYPPNKVDRHIVFSPFLLPIFCQDTFLENSLRDLYDHNFNSNSVGCSRCAIDHPYFDHAHGGKTWISPLGFFWRTFMIWHHISVITCSNLFLFVFSVGINTETVGQFKLILNRDFIWLYLYL